ncbi:MAG: hypothetical protein MRK01_13955 [Candidatus Scalindua sp.]|nr:hypothetical protein [Candidatus Scalindua sp.]
MKLPNVQNAEIPSEKITDYLLSSSSRAGKAKAKFFMSFGFVREKWEEVVKSLIHHAKENEISGIKRTIFGTKYIIDGFMKSPDGSLLNVRTVWFIDDDGDSPRFVTAHPLKKEKK